MSPIRKYKMARTAGSYQCSFNPDHYVDVYTDGGRNVRFEFFADDLHGGLILSRAQIRALRRQLAVACASLEDEHEAATGEKGRG